MLPLNDIFCWKNQLGLLPINLFSSGQEDKYILLNGRSGDFCVDVNPDKTPDEYYSFAWSSNTKSFVAVRNDELFLYNWLKEKEEKYPLFLIRENLPKFYTYLIKDSYRSEYDIVPYIIDIYRSLRKFTNEQTEGVQAINQLFLLLIAYKEGVDFDRVNLGSWGLPNIEKAEGLEKYLDNLRTGIFISNKRLKPDLDLILRHAAGQLFQEAQKEAIFFDRSLNLWGTFDSEYSSMNKLYSSFHYTPSFLARSIVEYSLSKLNITNKSRLRILDPACGSSEFLLEALKQLKALKYSGTIEINAWDSSESAVNISNFLLAYEKKEWGHDLSITVKKVDNSLTEEWGSNYDLILMNPPFLSWELMDNNNRDIVSDILCETARKKPNLASAFVYKSVKHLKEDGIIGTVIPSSILLMDSYTKLRKEITEIVTLLLVGKLGNYVFEHALTDVSILIGKKPKSNGTPVLLWTKNEKGVATDALRSLRKVNYGQLPYVKENPTHNIYIPDNYPDKDNWKLISFQDQELKKHLRRLVGIGKLRTVEEIFNVKQGIRTGNSKVFIIKKEMYDELPTSEKAFFRPAIDNDSIKKGSIVTMHYMWYPYNSSEKLISSEEELASKVPNFYKKILLPSKDRLSSRAGIDPNSWWQLTRHREWLREEYAKLISTEFGKSGSFAFDGKGEYVFERGNAWIPKKDFDDIRCFYFYLSVFNSYFFNKLLSIYSRELLQGFDLGRKYTSEIPIPAVSEELKHSFVFNKLVDLGERINSGEFNYLEPINDYVRIDLYEIPKIIW